MKTKAILSGHCLNCGKESNQAFCNRECYLEYVRRDRIDPKQAARGREKKLRDALTDAMVRKCIYRQSRGEIKFDQMTPGMVAEKRDSILVNREKRKGWQAKPKTKNNPAKCCAICGEPITGRPRYCSDDCRKQKGRDDYYANRVHYLEQAKTRYTSEERQRRAEAKVIISKTCKWCGEIFAPGYGDRRRTYCSDTCGKRSEHWTKNLGGLFHNLKRAKVERAGDRFKKTEIYERDRWRCGICGAKVKQKLKYPHPLSASLDHITPIALGGTHTRDNVQLAHLSCNVLLGIGGVKQLRMFG